MVLTNIARKPHRRFQSSDSLRWVFNELRILASLVEPASTTRVTASLSNVWHSKVATHRLLVLGQFCDVESWRVRLKYNQRKWRTRCDVCDHTHSGGDVVYFFVVMLSAVVMRRKDSSFASAVRLLTSAATRRKLFVRQFIRASFVSELRAGDDAFHQAAEALAVRGKLRPHLLDRDFVGKHKTASQCVS